MIVFVIDFTKLLVKFRLAYPTFGFLTFMVISFILATICGVIMVVTSFLFPEPLTEEKRKLVWKSPLEPLREKGWPGIGNYKLLCAILAATITCLYVYFTFFVK